MKRARMQDMASLPKQIKTIQDTQIGESSIADASSSTRIIMRTSSNAKCAHIVGITHKALIEGERVGTGSFGICRLYTVKGISFSLEHINYVGKCYKGGSKAKLNNFQTEQGMQLLHPSIVWCIGFTIEAPWITKFPYYNGG